VTLACLWEHRQRFAGRKVVAYISGGNIALSDYARMVGEDDGSTQ
jgi:threonine dehydratase